MDDQVKLAVTAPPASHGNSNLIVLALPAASAPTRNHRPSLASLPAKERKIRIDADDGGLNPSQLGPNQESDEHELYARSQEGVSPCLEKYEKLDKNAVPKQENEGQRFLRKCQLKHFR